VSGDGVKEERDGPGFTVGEETKPKDKKNRSDSHWPGLSKMGVLWPGNQQHSDNAITKRIGRREGRMVHCG